MLIITTAKEVNDVLNSTHVPLKTIGFVPTMGALHEGHLSLIEKSKNDNDLTVCSIFVNPTQFNNAVDFEKYPKTVDQDVNLLKKVGCNIVFIPTIETIYPEGLTKKKYDFKGLDLVMEGKFRPGHFDGVAEVVLRLFDLIKPQKAYFGEKDFQQLQIIRLITKQFKPSVEVIGMPTLRETSGLAMSSRNKRLNEEELIQASLIYKIMQHVKQQNFDDFQKLTSLIENEFSKTKMELEYVSVCEETTLQEAKYRKLNEKYRIFIAAFLNSVRLIDNLEV